MQSFKSATAAAPAVVTLTNSDMYCRSSIYLRGHEGGGGRNWTSYVDLGELEQSSFHQEHAVDLSTSSIYSDMKPSNVVAVSNSSLQFGGLNTNMGSGAMGSSGAVADTGQFLMQKGTMLSVGAGGTLGSGNFENWGESGMADHSQQTDTSTDVDTDEKSQFHGVRRGTLVGMDSMERSGERNGDQKAYVQQLENSRLRLTQLEQELKQARQQGVLKASGYTGDQSMSGALAFDMDYARWLDEHQRMINDLRTAVSSQLGDNELRLLVDGVMSHYDEIFRLKDIGTKSDVFHMLSGMWKTPAERCFMWLGGFRSSEILKILGDHLEPLTDQQLIGICNLQQSSQQAEDALSQGMEALQQSLVETLSSNSLGPSGSSNVADYMGQMATAMGKLAMLENFLRQADLLRQQTLQQMHRILTTRQAARALLVINEYMSRLRALSSLWLARPKD
ncbi:transcription factor HBP-1b(c38)-like isoform X2 [Coffea arabica]|uniref:Transcription factor HBP-1b(C38)-like isoform X2 n=1 Tax=Coffea arabica TaxID=13443 RepID=A0ABM4W2I7_COFAR